jgi:hypothetical protein
MGGTCECRGKITNTYGISAAKFEEKRLHSDPGRVILKWMVEQRGMENTV